jgi:hypothetical protein
MGDEMGSREPRVCRGEVAAGVYEEERASWARCSKQR